MTRTVMPELTIELTKTNGGSSAISCTHVDGFATRRHHRGPRAAFFPLHDIVRHTAFACCILTLSPTGAGGQQTQATREISLRSGTRRLVVEFDAGSQPGWGDYMLSATGVYLATLEEFLGSPLGKGGTVQVAGSAHVTLDGRWVGGRTDVAARAVFIQYDLAPIGNPSLLYHELGHLWFAENVTDQAWLVEGVVSFLPIALSESGLDAPDPGAAWAHWGFRHTRYHRDLPTETDFRTNSTDDFTDWYRKTFKIQYLIFRELGTDGYRDFLRALLNHAPVNGAGPILDLLNEQEGIDWREFLSGWVFGNTYRHFDWSDFEDSDHDGLIDVAEYYSDTDPFAADSDGDGIPDGAEVRMQSDPRRSDNDVDLSQLGPFIDGNAEEWPRYSSTTVTERRGDSRGGSALDLVSMSYLVREGVLYVMVETGTPPQAREGVFFDILRDVDLDDRYDADFAFWLDHPAAPWQYDGGMILLPGLEGAMGGVYEVAIPLGQLEGEFQILPVLRDARGEFNYDEWDTWVLVEQ